MRGMRSNQITQMDMLMQTPENLTELLTKMQNLLSEEQNKITSNNRWHLHYYPHLNGKESNDLFHPAAKAIR